MGVLIRVISIWSPKNPPLVLLQHSIVAIKLKEIQTIPCHKNRAWWGANTKTENTENTEKKTKEKKTSLTHKCSWTEGSPCNRGRNPKNRPRKLLLPHSHLMARSLAAKSIRRCVWVCVNGNCTVNDCKCGTHIYNIKWEGSKILQENGVAANVPNSL